MTAEGGGTNDNGYKVQVQSIKEILDKTGAKRYRVQITDGVESSYAMMGTTSAEYFEKEEIIEGTVLRINQYQISAQAQTK